MAAVHRSQSAAYFHSSKAPIAVIVVALGVVESGFDVRLDTGLHPCGESSALVGVEGEFAWGVGVLPCAVPGDGRLLAGFGRHGLERPVAEPAPVPAWRAEDAEHRPLAVAELQFPRAQASLGRLGAARLAGE